MEIEPNDLLLFARIVEAGSFSAAAARVNAALDGLEQVRAAFTTTGPAPGARGIRRSG